MNNQKNVTYFEARKWASFRIKDSLDLDMYDVDFILEHRSQLSATGLLINYQRQMPDNLWQQFQQDIAQLLAGIPPQYIVGEANFYGLSITVTPAVLIPRIETEELIDWILAETSAQHCMPLSVLDIGTGSGAIALALKKQCPTWHVSGSDISQAALRVAADNAKRLGLPIKFIQSDVFDKIESQFDMIVSNPPYISHHEQVDMDKRVIENEPALALYADDDGLAIYKRIANDVQSHLAVGGSLFMEIGFHQEQAVVAIFRRAMPRATIKVKHDVAGHQRMIQVRK
ncbi:peptide chain release factor N(5)-glutamine methyltransferase [Lentilactobacillus kisonensis]|uniref:Release factor glutamine methyltransferase n=2 Tax=Lentilactobacillus kisonensis TaxID=481722 RepID=H1LJZ3_9LACO|nr:peptide chain release factor N(5)-glutamine methyltransferase [Lentilactobacillus kisonensis]EHO48109.1 protein-(glutamine-N5) methyltransferase [Lentilactobacillus kisonensis F0435]KRL21587.1 protein-(glutamine-N5) methyltransferase [Lentilactobacillus kisonensis DSM 19906 = JCM 15041]